MFVYVCFSPYICFSLRDDLYFIRLFYNNVFLVQSIIILIFLSFYYLYSKDKKNYKFNFKFSSLMYIEGFLYGLFLVYFLTTFTTIKKNTGKKLTYPVKKKNVILPF